MNVVTELIEIPAGFGPSAVAIGKFDGVHVGHHRMIDELFVHAREDLLVPTVLTFDRNPLSVLAPASCPADLMSNAQKVEVLDRLGLDTTVMLTFDRAFSESPPEDFITNVLVAALNAKAVYVGPDFRFGKGGKGDVTLLEELGRHHGFAVHRIDVVAIGGRRVSSTWVRELLTDGNVRDAKDLLRRPPSVRGTVVRGARRGRLLGFPTANLAPDPEGFIPADGVYAAWATVDGGRYPAAVSIGNNPTFDKVPARQVEAHLLAPDFAPVDIDLYGRTINLEFIERIRGMEKFDNVDALVVRMSADVADASRILAADQTA